MLSFNGNITLINIDEQLYCFNAGYADRNRFIYFVVFVEIIYLQFQTVATRAGPFLIHRDRNCTTVVDILDMMLHTKYERSGPFGLGQEDY